MAETFFSCIECGTSFGGPSVVKLCESCWDDTADAIAEFRPNDIIAELKVPRLTVPVQRPRHPTVIVGMETDDIVKQLADLRYDSLSLILSQLAVRLMADSDKDWERDRRRLAGNLQLASERLTDASKYLDRAWEICRPHMEATTPPKKDDPK